MNNRPNFLFIFPDQWRGDCLGTLGHKVVETPFLDQLASEGITFTNAYSPAPSCIPARACLLTGQTPSTCGRMGYMDGVPWRYDNTFPRILRDSGYQTLCAGKTHFYPQRASLGFEEMRLYDTQNIEGDYKSDYAVWLDRVSGGMVRDTAVEMNTNSWVVHPWTAPENMHPTNWTVDAAVELLSRRDPTRPFMIQVGFHRPHTPLDPPRYYYEMYRDRKLPPVPVGEWSVEYDMNVKFAEDTYFGHLPDHILDDTRRAYYAQLTHIDFQIGRLLNWMKKNKLLENSYVIFASDHGDMLGDHHLFRKFNALEASAKVPLIVKPPKSVECTRGIKCDLPVSLIDIMPTMLDISDIPIPDTVEGRSLLPIVCRKTADWREYVHLEHSKYPGEGPAFCYEGWQSVTDGKEKYIWETVSGREWFFNLREDPDERINLSGNENYKNRIELWKRRLVEILSERIDDGLVDGEMLSPGKGLPAVRYELLERKVDADGKVRPMIKD